MKIRQALPADHAAIETLLDAAFGADRHQRTAYRVREGTSPIADLSFVAEENGRIIGSLQCWPVELRGAAGAVSLIMLGPVAVEPDLQRAGIGKLLMKAALDAADSGDHEPLMLIGDAEYYGRFGFVAGPAHEWELPGPFERHRLLVRNQTGVDIPCNGQVGPRAVSAQQAAS